MINVYIYAVDFTRVYLSTANFTRVRVRHPLGTQKTKKTLKRKKIDVALNFSNYLLYSNAFYQIESMNNFHKFIKSTLSS